MCWRRPHPVCWRRPPHVLEEAATVCTGGGGVCTRGRLPTQVREARCDPSGKFAFVEFTTEALAATALQLFNGMELCGRDMKLARPSGYVARFDFQY